MVELSQKIKRGWDYIMTRLKRKKIVLPYKLLIYDVETSYLEARIWRPGEQVVRHDQLVPGRDQYKIITLSYRWFGEPASTTKCLDWGYNEQNSAGIIEEFDQLVKQADVIIGKNNKNFDDKHINTQRMIHGLEPFPQWAAISDDLQQQLKRFFAFPSQSLDYISNIMGLGGKDKMEMSDWVHIVERTPKLGPKAFQKMIKYNKKDVNDTHDILERVLPYIKLKYNCATQECKSVPVCTLCGEMKVVPDRIIIAGQTKYQEFYCTSHRGYAGRCTFKWNKSRHKVYGKMV